MTPAIPARVATRALDRHVTSLTGCHLSTYSSGSHGYAQIGWNDELGNAQVTTAHRAAWVAAHGQQIPKGMTVDHICKERRCVNPEHLRVLSNFENARRTFGRDWPLGQCPQGHTNSNLQRVGGRLRCSICVGNRYGRRKS